MAIADTVREGKKARIRQKDGTTEEHGDTVDRSRLMMDSRKSQIMLPEMPEDRSNQDQPAADAGRELTEPLVIIAIAGDELGP